jgi:hypothetical protein
VTPRSSSATAVIRPPGIALALVAALAGIGACRQGVPTVAPRAATQVIDVTPAAPTGPERAGTCFAASLAVMRPGAYRCSAGNDIQDPCFVVGGATDSVVCGEDPTTGQGAFTLRLTEPLPTEQNPLDPAHAWMVRLADGTDCGYMTGGTGGVDGERLNYGCTDESWLVGDLKPGDVWTARRVKLNADLTPVAAPAEVSIATVWR